MCDCVLYGIIVVLTDTVAERLRRLTRNQLGLSRVGSSPASVDYTFPLFFHQEIPIQVFSFMFMHYYDVYIGCR